MTDFEPSSNDWYVEIYDVRGARVDHWRTSFQGTTAAVVARAEGETVRFIAPNDAPAGEIDALVKMGAVRTFA